MNSKNISILCSISVTEYNSRRMKMHQAPRNLDNYQTHILDHQRIQSQNHSLRHTDRRVGPLCNTNPEKNYVTFKILCV